MGRKFQSLEDTIAEGCVVVSAVVGATIAKGQALVSSVLQVKCSSLKEREDCNAEGSSLSTTSPTDCQAVSLYHL